MNEVDFKRNKIRAVRLNPVPDDRLNAWPAFPIDIQIDGMTTQANLDVASNWLFEHKTALFPALVELETPTEPVPVVQLEHRKQVTPHTHPADPSTGEDYVALLRKLMKSSSVYSLASVVSPLISLALAPFLTRFLSSSDYGILTILNTLISLLAGISQSGLGSAFFRSYNFDYTSPADKRAVLSSITVLLFIFSFPLALVMIIMAPSLAHLLLNRPEAANLILIAGCVVCVQNLTVPGFSWLRAESRSLFFSLLSISSLLITLLANLILVGVLHWGVAGSLIATGCGYMSTIMCTLPAILLRTGLKVRTDIMRNLLAFGSPLILSFISYWILQLSDRYLLGHFGSLSQTAKYGVAYTLGAALSVVVITPFTLAWPTIMFTVAKRDDAAQVFRVVFHWFGLLLLLAAFGLSVVATVILDMLFPISYHSAAPIIPVIAASIVFYGIYYVFMIGANITRKTWLTAVFTTIAAVVNIILNLILIPHYGAMGAALSTFVAYVALVLAAYIVNQRIYPIPFQLSPFVIALLIGIVLYKGSDYLTQSLKAYESWGIHLCALCLYAVCLFILGKVSAGNVKDRRRSSQAYRDAYKS